MGKSKAASVDRVGSCKARVLCGLHSCTQVIQENGGTCGSGKVVTHEPKSSVNMEEPSECHSMFKRTRVRKQVGKKPQR